MRKFRKFIRTLLKRTYLLNKRTGETHDTTNRTKQCGFVDSKNRRYITYKKFKGMKGKGEPLVNGCRWCMPKYDLG